MSGRIKIISGGQAGVDRAALEWALERGWEAGGWCPRGRGSEDGPIAARFPLEPTPSADPAERTEWNVRDSDGTLILSLQPELRGGTALTRALAERLGRPWLHVTARDAAGPAAERLQQFLRRHAIHRLNVAGPRESEEPGVGDWARRFLDQAFRGREAAVEQPA